MKIPAAKGDEVLLEQIKRALSPIPGMLHIEVNPSTGSVILHYDPDVHEAIHDSLHEHGSDHFKVAAASAMSLRLTSWTNQLEEEAKDLAEHSDVARAIVDFCRGLDREIKLATDNAVDLKVLVPLGLAGYTFLVLGFEAATPVWLTLGMFSLNHFVELHAEPAGRGRAVPSAVL